MTKVFAGIQEDVYPLLLPHVTVGDGKLWLGTAELCELTAREENYCRLCDGTRSLEHIIEEAGPPPSAPQATAFIVPLLSSLAIAGEQPKSKRVLVISPTPQTGYMAAGGTLAKWADAEVLHLVCFSQTKDAVFPEIFTSAAGVSAIRRDESTLCAAICGCNNRFLNYPAYSLRKEDWPGTSSAEHPRELAAALQAAVYQVIREFAPSVIMAPAAIGNHPDHALLNRMAIDFFKQDFFSGTRFLLYQDFPYAIAYNMIDDFLWKTEHCFVRLQDHFEDISGQLALKDILYTIYFSALAGSDRQLVNHIARRNKLACADPLLQDAAGLEHFYELLSFN